MTYLVRLGDRLWLTRVERDWGEGSEDTYGTADVEQAAQFHEPRDAAVAIGRVSTVRPWGDDNKLRRPLLDVGARIQHIEDAREEALG